MSTATVHAALTPQAEEERLLQLGDQPAAGGANALGTTPPAPAGATKTYKKVSEVPSPSTLDEITSGKGLAGEVVDDVVEWARPAAEKVTLYIVLIFGGVAMMIYGASETLKPVGGPDLAGKTRSLLKDSAEAAAA